MPLFGRSTRLSKPELLLLSKFNSPASPKRFEKSELWSEALGRSARRAISDFSRAGLLERPNLQGLIEGAFTVADLKKVLGQAGSSTSGRKADLVARLIANDDATAENMARDLDLLVCSSEGSEIAQEYLAQVDQDRKRTETSVLDALEHSRFEEASKIVAKFEADQVFSRGIGIDWTNYDSGRDIAILTSIFSTVPKILNAVPPAALPKLRIRAGVLHLWGTNRLRGDLAEEFDTGTPLDVTTAARMLLFHAIHLDNMREYRELEVRSIRILTANDENVCEACKQISEKVIPLEQVPELPFQACTSEMGCRCTTVVEEFAWQ